MRCKLKKGAQNEGGLPLAKGVSSLMKLKCYVSLNDEKNSNGGHKGQTTNQVSALNIINFYAPPPPHPSCLLCPRDRKYFCSSKILMKKVLDTPLPLAVDIYLNQQGLLS